jgi:hypothetical protein
MRPSQIVYAFKKKGEQRDRALLAFSNMQSA